MKSAIVSGITRGIGRAIAERFARGGYAIAGCARTEADIARLRGERPDWRLEACDLADREAARAFAARVPAPDVVVNNAGRFVPGHLKDAEDGVLEDMLAANLFAPYHLTRAVLAAMIARKNGTIVNIASIASVAAYTAGSAYSVAKFALLGMSRALRAELAPHGVRVVTVIPGATYTPPWEPAGIPEERFVSADDLAELVFAACEVSGRTVVEELLVRPQLGDI